MGYQIQYGFTMMKTHIPDRKKFSVSRKNVNVLIVCIVILFAVFLGSREQVQNFFLPGNSQVTRAAVSKMVTDLKDGEPLAASIEAFCREIVNGANIPE